MFWLCLTILSIPRCRTEAREKPERDNEDNPENNWAEYKYGSFMTFFAASIAMVLLNCFADQEPRESKYPKTEVGFFL